MITNQDRSGWFGASDTNIIMGNWETKTFALWWMEKRGTIQNAFTNKFMEFGNIVEHAIIDAIDPTIKKGIRPIYVREYRIRVNYDGMKPDHVVEIKTSLEGFKRLPKSYWQQAQVLMFAAQKRRCRVYVYRTIPEEYDRPYFLEVDKSRITHFDVTYDPKFIRRYLERVVYLKQCLKDGTFPVWRVA